MKSRIQFLYAILAFLAAEAIQIIIVFGYQMIYGVFVGFQAGFGRGSQGITDPEVIADQIQNSMNQDMLYMISALAVLICGIVFAVWYRSETSWESTFSLLRNNINVKNIVLIILLGFGCQLFVTGIMSVIKQYFVDVFSEYSDQMERLTNGNMIMVLMLMIFIAPITEELIFRGVVLHKASKALPFWGANLLQATLFGFYHWNIVQGIYAAFIGFVLGLVCHKYKNIYASILLHMVINISSLPVALFPQNNLSYSLMIFTGGLFAILSLLFMNKPFDLMKRVNQS